MEAIAVRQRSKREAVMEYVWDRCVRAWTQGDFDQAENLHRMYASFEGMTDEEWECAYNECDPSDL